MISFHRRSICSPEFGRSSPPRPSQSTTPESKSIPAETQVHHAVGVGGGLLPELGQLGRALVYRGEQRIQVPGGGTDLPGGLAVIEHVERPAVGGYGCFVGVRRRNIADERIERFDGAIDGRGRVTAGVERLARVRLLDRIPSSSCWMAAWRWSLISCGNCWAVRANILADEASWSALDNTCTDSGWAAS